MELWIVYALLSAITAGIYSFLLKVAAEKHYNPTSIILYSNFVSVIILIIFAIILRIDLFTTIIYSILFGALNMFTYYFGVISRIYSLKHIDATIYFPIYKTLGPLIVLFVSFFLFQEPLSSKEWIGILLGLTVPLLLLSKHENGRQKNLKLGLILLLAGTILTSISATGSKLYIDLGYEIFGFILFSQIMGISMGILDLKVNKKSHLNKEFSNKGIHKLGISLGVLNLLTIIFFLEGLRGNLAIAFTLNSFSILITIILSVIIYKEHFNLRKALAVILSIAAVIFFI